MLHSQHAAGRGVHELSTMGRAVGGPARFAESSPTVVLRAALARGGGKGGKQRAGPQVALRGDVLAHRIGLTRSGSCSGSGPSESPGALRDVMPGLTAGAAARHLPPCVLQSSCSDVTVPWYESAELYWDLRDCGVPARSLVYNRVGHGDFVVGWRPLPTPVGVHSLADLPDFAADLVTVLGVADN